jgi:FkbM family methyltransferase
MNKLPVGEDVSISPLGQVVRAVIWGQPVYFTITHVRDSIQRHHLTGSFYEPEELEIIRQFCPPGSVYCDIGANIGNHVLFALKFLHVEKAILFEPNPKAIEILLSNLALNGLTARCDLRHLGLGLSDHAQDGLGIEAPNRNLGGGRMVEGAGELRVIPGDLALADTHVDFIKIDVEGMEMKALGGLAQTIARCRPRIFIELDRANKDAFVEWIKANHYEIRARFRRYRVNENFLLVPRALPEAVAETAAAAVVDQPQS